MKINAAIAISDIKLRDGGAITIQFTKLVT
jgi:hypothetical protein